MPFDVAKEIEKLRAAHRSLSEQIALEKDASFLADLISAKQHVRRKLRRLRQKSR
jgi:hypothetical protein